MSYQQSLERESERGNKISSLHINNPSSNHQVFEPVLALVVLSIEQ